MPRWRRFKNHSKSESHVEQQLPTAYGEVTHGRPNMVEGSFDVNSILPANSTVSPPDNEDENLARTETISSWTTTTPHLVEIHHKKAAEVSPADSHHEDSSTLFTQTGDLSYLRFRPLESTDYARRFARAILAAYISNMFPGASQRDRIYAERVVQGEGGELVFRPSYVASHAIWNGEDARLRRAALTHILGVSGANCKVDGCPYRGNACVGCENPAFGVFEGCRHSHDNPQKLGCANCAVGTLSSGCSVRGVRKDSKDICREHILNERESRSCFQHGAESRMGMRSSHTLFQDTIHGLHSRRHTVQIGPVLNDFFVSRREGSPNDFDIWMAMRKRAIDYEPEVLAMECRLARLWSSVLEDELGKQKAAGFQEGG